MEAIWIISPPLASWAWLADYWAAIAIALTCLCLLVFGALVIGKYVGICLNIFSDTPLPIPPSLLRANVQPLRGEEVRFRSFDGTSLQGMWLRAPGPVRREGGAIVFCHEFGSDMYSCARYVRPLIEAGFDVFTFDFRGHGDSSCPRGYRLLQWPSDKELEDVLGATAYVEEALSGQGRPVKIGIVGISRGAGAAILAASSDPHITCLVCDGVFSTTETLVALMKRWAYIFARVKLVYENHPDAFWRFLLWCMMRLAQPKLGRRFPSVRKALQNMVSRPVMFIHGARDSYIRPPQAELLHRVAAEPKFLWVVPGAKHNQAVLIAPQAYADRTIAFFRKYLAGEDVDAGLINGRSAEADVA